MSRPARGQLLTAVLLVSACSALRAPTQVPEIRLAGIELERLAVNQQVFLLRLVLDNPNDVPLRVAAGRLRLDLEDLRTGTGELVEGFSVPAGEQGTATVRIVTDLVSQAPQFLAWLLSGNATLNYRLTGYIDLAGLGLGRIPVDERGLVPLRPRSRSGAGGDNVRL